MHRRQEHRVVHLGGLVGRFERDGMLQRKHREERAGQQLDRSHDDPTRSRHQQRSPPGRPVVAGALRKKAQVVDLLADLRQQRQQHRARHADLQQVRCALRPGVPAAEAGPGQQVAGAVVDDIQDRQELQQQPDGLRDQLQAADQTYAVDRDRYDHGGADHVRKPCGDAEDELQGCRKNAGLDGEQQEGERRIDERGDGRAEVAEAGAAGEQVDVDAVPGRVEGDGQADEEHDHREYGDSPQGVAETIRDGDGATDRLHRQERHRAHGGVADAKAGAARARCREAQRVILQGLARNPLVILTALDDDALLSAHAGPIGRGWGNGRKTCAIGRREAARASRLGLAAGLAYTSNGPCPYVIRPLSRMPHAA